MRSCQNSHGNLYKSREMEYISLVRPSSKQRRTHHDANYKLEFRLTQLKETPFDSGTEIIVNIISQNY